MIAENLISDSIVPLRTSDTGEEALEIMNEFHVRHLPIVNNEQLLGLISEEDILDRDIKEDIGSFSLSVQYPYVQANDHLYEVMRLFAEQNLTVIPVVTGEQHYIGMILLEDLLHYFAASSSFTDPGSIVVLEMGRVDYSLSEIARIVESEGAVILSAFVHTYPESARIEVTIKINRQSIGAIIATLERFDYNIKAAFNEQQYQEVLKDRYDSLINYLNV
jgi:CBS domain-containing protein